MIEDSDTQGNLYFKAFSIRGLGEVAFARGNFAVAAQPERFEGWALFLECRSPFASAI
jgi:hypothetical protein